MPDHRRTLQASFEPNRRHTNYGDALVKVRIRGIRHHADTLLNIESPVTAFCGVNGTGKSTVLQLAAAAYQAVTGKRFYFSTFILAGTLDLKPFADDASVEFTYAEPPSTAGVVTDRTLTVSRLGSSWSGYDRQPQRRVAYLGFSFYTPHADRDDHFKSLVQDRTFTSRSKLRVGDSAAEWVSRILLCKYDAAHVNSMRKKWGRSVTQLISADRGGGLHYSESNMGSGEARLYAMVLRLEALPEKSLVLLEEPETSLHPSAQYELAKYLANVAERRKLQILLTTHSEYLLLALPEKSRIYLKREGARIVPLPGIGVRQAVSMMDNLAVPSIYILVEDDVAEAIVRELLRSHDSDFLKTVRIIIAGDATKIQQTIEVFLEQNMPICAVRDGDKGGDPRRHLLKLFGTEPPEKEVFKSVSFRDYFQDTHGIDWGAVDIANNGRDHHYWFDTLETQSMLTRPELLSVAARQYLIGISEAERTGLARHIKASTL
jgi:ABC-type branched-subunit amino acid transport system ATPase component